MTTALRRLRVMAPVVAMVCCAIAGADTATTQPAPAQAAAPAGAPAPERKPLMAALDGIGLAEPLEDAGINIYGFVEGSYTYNLTAPSGGFNEGRAFDIDKNDFLLNQADITVERTVDPSKGKFDAGFRVEMIYGSDAAFIHSNGLFDWYDGRDPRNQWDLNQAYGDLAFPLGNGLRLRGGKYVTPLGAETINPNGNWLYSRSYLFTFAIPFTHTGLIGTYALNDQWTIEGGVFRGWEQSVDDNNDAASFEGKAAWTSEDKKLTLTHNLVSGPEQADNSRDFRTVYDLVGAYTPDPEGPWTFMVNGDYGFENFTGGADDGQWYGVAGYAGYKLNSMFTLNSRLEWFRDNDGTRTGVAANFYEVTAGVAIHPFSSGWGANLVIRPELRYDHCSTDFYDGGNDDNQVTAAVDVIFNF